LPVFRQSEFLIAILTSIHRSLPRVGLSTYGKATRMILHRTTRFLRPAFSLGLLFGLSGASTAAESSAGVGSQNPSRAEPTANLLLADGGSPQQPLKKETTKRFLKRKLAKKLHSKTKSLHSKMGRKKGSSSHHGKKGHPPATQKSTAVAT
jgi:hypothetical protein